MIEKGISPPPKAPQNIDREGWAKWFQLLTFRFPKMETYSVTLNPASVAANTTSEQTFALAGLNVKDIVTVNKPTHDAGLGIVGARVSAAGTLAITFMNTTGAAINAPSEVYHVATVRL